MVPLFCAKCMHETSNLVYILFPRYKRLKCRGGAEYIQPFNFKFPVRTGAIIRAILRQKLPKFCVNPYKIPKLTHTPFQNTIDLNLKGRVHVASPPFEYTLQTGAIILRPSPSSKMQALEFRRSVCLASPFSNFRFLLLP